MLKCPRCGQRLEIAQLPLTFRQRKILQILERIERELGRPVPTKRLADEMVLSVATIKNELVHLEHMKRVHRPNGKKSGYAILDDQEIKLILAA